MAYRRRFLLEKYPHLNDDDTLGTFAQADGGNAEDADENISVVRQIAEAGGPDFA